MMLPTAVTSKIRMSVVCSDMGAKWSRASVLPRVFPRPKRGGLLSPSRAVTTIEYVVLKNGGLCGLCSRDLPLDRRLLFVTELTGHMVGCVGNAPTRPSQGHPLYRRLAVFTRLTTLE